MKSKLQRVRSRQRREIFRYVFWIVFFYSMIAVAQIVAGKL